MYLGYGFSFLFGVYVTRLDVLGWGWRASYILAGLPGIALAAAMLLLPGNYHQYLAKSYYNYKYLSEPNI